MKHRQVAFYLLILVTGCAFSLVPASPVKTTSAMLRVQLPTPTADVTLKAQTGTSSRGAFATYNRMPSVFEAQEDPIAKGTVYYTPRLLNDTASLCVEGLEDVLEVEKEMVSLFGDNPQGEVRTLHNLGAAYLCQGRYEEALAQYKAALPISQQIKDLVGQATTLHNIGVIYQYQGRYKDALEQLETALTVWHRASDQTGEGTTLNSIGLVYEREGRYEEALRQYERALTIWRSINQSAEEGKTLYNIAALYQTLGQYERALENYEKAVTDLDVSRLKSGDWTVFGNLGVLYYSLGRYKEALDCYDIILSIAQSLDDKAREGATLNNIGMTYYRQERYDEALKQFEAALALVRELRDRAAEGMIQNNIGLMYLAQGRYTEALAQFQEALAITREIGDRVGEGQILGSIGFVGEQQGHLQGALDSYRQATVIIEAIRGSLSVEEFKITFAADYTWIYERFVLLLFHLGQHTEAFEYTERARARAFLDQMGNQRVDIHTGADTDLLRQEQNLRGEIAALDARLREEWAKPQNQRSQEVIQSLTTQRETQRAEYARLLTSLKLNNPEYASLVTVNPLTLTETQKILTNMTLIEYFVTVSQTVAFVVTQNDFHAVQVTVTEDSLVKAVQDLYAFPSLEGVPAPLKALYRHLVAPVKPYLKTDLVVIAPHNVLHYVPFGALHDGKQYLVEQYTLSYAPSASVLPFAFAKRKSSVALPLILGDPDGSLLNSRQEVQAIAKLYGTQAYVGKDALEKLVWEQGKEAGILHLSTHGVYDQRSPLFSNVLLAGDDKEDGHLDVYEIYNRGLNLAQADLVVLSACQSSVGELSRGDEIVGLNRALIYAGTPSVIASLWSVSDESTRVLMEKFYTHLRAGESKAGALRAAQMEMIASGEYAHPYHWAAFGVTGDPGEGKGVAPGPQAAATSQVTRTPTKTPTSGKSGNPICPAAVLPVALFVLIAVKGRR